jgi:hypothetical protein
MSKEYKPPRVPDTLVILRVNMYAEPQRMICTKCNTKQKLTEFGKDATATKGISSWCKRCKREARKAYRKANPEATKLRDFKSDLKRHYGLTINDYNAMLEGQKHCCACCGQHSSNFKRGLHVDHDHTTGLVRGLLCTECNPGIGYFQDSVERLEMAITYLTKFRK